METIRISVHHFVTMVTVVLTLTALILGSLAVSGHVDYRDDSIPVKAINNHSELFGEHGTGDTTSAVVDAVLEDGELGAQIELNVAVAGDNTLSLGGVAVTASAAEINRLSGVNKQGTGFNVGTGGVVVYDSSNTNYLILDSPSSITSNYTLTFPASVSSGVLSSDATGNISIGSVSGATKLQDLNDGDSGSAKSIKHNEQLTFGTSTGKLILDSAGAAEIDAVSDIILDASGDITLDADGGDIFLKDGGTTFGALVQTGGELVVKSGSTPTTAMTFSGADVTHSGNVTITSADSTEPILHITNTNADATSGELRFNKDSASGADSDVMGMISFYGTDSSNNTHERLAYMDAVITDAAHGSEASSLRFYVAENDATLTAGLTIAGQADDDGEVDVTIGAGVGSTTAVSGILTVAGAGTFTGTLAATNAATVGTTLGVTGVATFASHVELGDSDILKIGAGADLQIQHNATNSIISNSTGDLQINGATGREVVFNEDGANVDFRIEGDANTFLFFADASTDRLGVSENAPQTLLHVTQGSGTVPSLESETGFLLQNNTSTTTSSMMCILAGNAGNSQINFGDTDDDRAAVIKYSHSNNNFDIRGNGTDSLVTISSTGLIKTKGGVTSQDSDIILQANSADANDLQIIFQKSRHATDDSHTVVADNDELGTIQWFGSDGTDYAPAAEIFARVNGTPGDNDMPTELVFATTADGANAVTERMTISAAGVLTIAGSASGTDALVLTAGDILVTSGHIDMTVGDLTLADGSVSITDADNASSLSITNNTITTADALVDISSTSISTGAMMRINANAATHDGEILELINAGDATSTGTGLSITMPDITTGAAKGIDVVMVGATTTAKGISVTMDAITTGDMLYLDNGGGTMTGDGKFINCNDDDTSVFSVASGGLTTISGVLTQSGAITGSSGGTTNWYSYGAGAISTSSAPGYEQATIAGVIISRILIDLTSLGVKGDAANDVIGLPAGGAAYIGKNVVSEMGLIYKAEVAILEAFGQGTATITNDIDIAFNSSATLAYDGGAGTAEIDLGLAGGTAGASNTYHISIPTADDYIYLVEGDTAATTGVYNAGKLLITFYGHATF